MIGVYLWEFFMDFIWGWFRLGFLDDLRESLMMKR